MPGKFYLIIALLLFTRLSFAFDTIRVSGTGLYDLNKNNILVLKDPQGKLTFEEVQKRAFVAPLPQESKADGEFLFTKNNHQICWIKFVVEYHSEKHWLIEFLDFNTSRIDFYVPDANGRYTVFKTGFSIPFNQRDILHKNFNFDLPDNKKASTYYARIDPGNSTILSVQIKSYNSFINYSITEYYLLGLFYGIILVMGIYNLILYINIREPHYLFYVFYVICIALSAMCHDGTGFQYLWPNAHYLNDDFLVFSLFGLVLWTLFYSKWFLNIKRYAPRTDKIIQILIAFIGVAYFIVEIFHPENLSYLIPLAAIPFLIIFLSGLRILRAGFKPARLFLMAFSFFFLGYIIRVLTYYNVIDTNIFTVYSSYIGVLIEMILFSIAIGDRVRDLKQEKEFALIEKEQAQRQIIYQLQENEKLKDKVNKELEHKVAARTVELFAKNKELEVANEKLKVLTDKVNEWNIRLDLDNRKLLSDVKQLSQARILLKDVKFEEFNNVFPDERTCLKYLADLKWKEGYSCKKCGNSNYGKGKSLFGRRCTKCNYDESATNDTLFHRLRFPITKAFYMVYLVSMKDKEVTADQLSEMLSLRRETCWSFKRKILLARKNQKKQPKPEDADGWAALALISLNQ